MAKLNPREPHPNFLSQFPKSARPVAKGGLALQPVVTGDSQHSGFDENEVKAALGAARFNNLMALIAAGKNGYSGAVFSCGHAKDAKGVEVHCIYASDLELFLANGG